MKINKKNKIAKTVFESMDMKIIFKFLRCVCIAVIYKKRRLLERLPGELGGWQKSERINFMDSLMKDVGGGLNVAEIVKMRGRDRSS